MKKLYWISLAMSSVGWMLTGYYQTVLLGIISILLTLIAMTILLMIEAQEEPTQ